MRANQLAAIWRAETSRLFSRGAARVGLVVLVGLGALVPLVVLAIRLVLWWTMGPEATFPDGETVTDKFVLPAPAAMAWALTVRNFFVTRAFVILLAALSFAGEYQARTLREDLIRPVSRSALLLAKWGALATWLLVAAVLSTFVAMLLALVFFGGSGDWGGPLLGVAASLLSDVVFAALVLAIAVLTRSVAFTIAGVFLFAVLDYAADWGLWIAGMASQFPPIQQPWIGEVANALYPWMPFSAFGVWRGYLPDAAWEWQGFVSLGILTVLSVGIALVGFRRMDVP